MKKNYRFFKGFLSGWTIIPADWSGSAGDEERKFRDQLQRIRTGRLLSHRSTSINWLSWR